MWDFLVYRVLEEMARKLLIKSEKILIALCFAITSGFKGIYDGHGFGRECRSQTVGPPHMEEISISADHSKSIEFFVRNFRSVRSQIYAADVSWKFVIKLGVNVQNC